MRPHPPCSGARAGPVLHFDASLFLGDEAGYENMIKHEHAERTSRGAKGKRFPYVLCGPQGSSARARADLKATTNAETVQVPPRPIARSPLLNLNLGPPPKKKNKKIRPPLDYSEPGTHTFAPTSRTRRA